MPAPDPIKQEKRNIKQAPPIGNASDASLHAFPSALRETTYVSAQGQVYRLFPEDEVGQGDARDQECEQAYRLFPEDEAPVLQTLKFNILQCEEQLADTPKHGRRADLAKSEIMSVAESMEPMPPLDEIGPFFSAPSVTVPLQEKPTGSAMTLDNTFKRIRAVEGVCGRNQATIHGRIFDAISEGGLTPSNPSVKKPVPTKISGISVHEISQVVKEGKPTAGPMRPDSSFRPARQGITIQSRPLFEKGGAIDLNSILQFDLVPVVDEVPDFLHRAKSTSPTTLTASSFVPLQTVSLTELPIAESVVTEQVPSASQESPIQESQEIIVAKKTCTETVEVQNNQFDTTQETVVPCTDFSWSPTWPSYLDIHGTEAGEQVRLLCNHLFQLHQSGKRIINFNGFHPGEGCTTMVLCAARELAARGLHVLLAEAHEQKPDLARILGVPHDQSLYEIVVLQDRLEFLPWSDGLIEVEHEGETTTRNFTELVSQMRNDYDLILLDNGRLSEGPLVDRVRLWHEMSIDGVLLVVNPQKPQKAPLEAILHRLNEHQIELLGISENVMPQWYVTPLSNSHA